MTEQQWLRCTDAATMIAYLQSLAPKAWFAQSWFADRLPTRPAAGLDPSKVDFLIEALRESLPTTNLGQQIRTLPPRPTFEWLFQGRVERLAAVLEQIDDPEGPGELRGGQAWETVLERRCPLIREIFGNPFHQVSVDRSLVSSAALRLADAIVRDSTFERMPFLADALEESGCSDTCLLEHLRGPGPHVRGCWAIQVILEK